MTPEQEFNSENETENGANQPVSNNDSEDNATAESTEAVTGRGEGAKVSTTRAGLNEE